VRYRTRVALDDHGDLVDAYLDVHPDISRETAMTLLGVGPTRASQILAELASRGRLARRGPARGSSVRFVRP
jgi:hypothetical protein